MRHKIDYEHNYWDNIGKGVLGDNIPVNKFGRNPAVSTSTPEDIWDTGGSFVEAPTAEVVNIKSSVDEDDNTTPNTGARTIEVRGVGGPNGEYNLANEIVDMNGQVNVLTLNKYWFIHEIEVTESGATGANEGNITAITTASGTPTLATMLVGLNKTFMGMMMVPDGYYLWIKHWNSSVRLAAGGNGEYALQIKPAGEVFQPVEIVGVATDSGTKRIPFEPIIGAPPRSIVKVRVLGLSAASMICSSSFMGELEKVVSGYAPPKI